eukprot:6954222-Pyramimonas_sp.AAC.1
MTVGRSGGERRDGHGGHGGPALHGGRDGAHAERSPQAAHAVGLHDALHLRGQPPRPRIRPGGGGRAAGVHRILRRHGAGA